MEYFEQRMAKLTLGKDLADRYCTLDNTDFYIVVNRHLGDAIRTLRYLPAIRQYYGEQASRNHFQEKNVQAAVFRKKKLIKRLFVITTPSITGIAKLFSRHLDGIITLNKPEVDAIELYAFSGCGKHHNIICDTHAGARVRSNWETDEGEYTRTLMFGVGDLNWELCLPKETSEYFANAEIDEATLEETKEIIRKNDMPVEHTVLLSPVAQSSSMLEEQTWIQFCKWLKERGFKVFTNVHGKEMPIEGSSPLDVGVNVIACLASMGYRIIGVQSGLVDVTVNLSPKHLTVLSVIRTAYDRQYADTRGSKKEVNDVNGVTYLRIEHFEEEYVLKLLEENFH